MHIELNLEREIYLYCQLGDIDRVKNCLDQGVDPNYVYTTGKAFLDDGCTFLMLAAMFDHKEIVELLLERGADVNLLDYNGYDALMLSVYDKYDEEVDSINLEIPKLLIDAGSSIGIESNHGCKFLDLLSDQDREKICDYISK